MVEQVRFRDFTRKRSSVHFQIGSDVFDCVKALSPVKLQEFMRTVRGSDETDETNVVERLANALKFIIAKESYPRFLELLDDDDDPVDLEQLREIMSWALEVYGARPTEASSSSSTPSETDDAGTSSTAGAPPEGSIP